MGSLKRKGQRMDKGMTITKAKQIWKDSLYGDNYINAGLKADDEVWQTAINQAKENERSFYEWLKNTGVTNWYDIHCSDNPATIFIEYFKSEYISRYKKDEQRFATIIANMAICLMDKKIQNPYIANEMLKQVTIIK